MMTPDAFSVEAKGKDEFNQPEKGQRFVAIQIALKNAGSIAYDDSRATARSSSMSRTSSTTRR
jgi:hypothetical protein